MASAHLLWTFAVAAAVFAFIPGPSTLYAAAQALAGAPGPAATGRRTLLQGVTVEVLNPKTATFFLAFLPQFVDPAAAWPTWLQFIVLGCVVNAIFAVADLTAVLMAAAVAARLAHSPGLTRAFDRTSGGLLVGLGAYVALRD